MLLKTIAAAALLGAASAASSAIQPPGMTFTKFERQPTKIFYSNDDKDQLKLILLEEAGRIWRSENFGKSFKRVEELKCDPKLVLVGGQQPSCLFMQHPYSPERVYFFNGNANSFTSSDMGTSWTKVSLEVGGTTEINGGGERRVSLAATSQASFAFHTKDPERIILQMKNCNFDGKNSCRMDAYYTLDSFKTPPKLLLEWTSQCEWAQSISSSLDNPSINDKVFCTQWPPSQQVGDTTFKDVGLLSLVGSDSFFSQPGQSIPVTVGGGFPILGITPNWLVGVVKSMDGYRLVTTKNGIDFVKAKFSSMDMGDNSAHSVGFSVLESSNSSLVVDVATTRPGSTFPLPFGTLFASSSDGKYFSKVLEHTNRDLSTGMVDFEHIQSSIYEGVQLANTVKNWQEIGSRVEVVKKLLTVMSFDNGRSWSQISPPTGTKANGDSFPCSSSNGDCYLHLHSVTTTKNVGKVFSVSSAPGTIIGVGSVGSHLAPYEESDTYMSHDSGVTWKHVVNGPHKFEILNFGSVLVLVPDSYKPSSLILYSTNTGKDWLSLPVSIDSADWIPLFTTLDPKAKSLKMLLVASKSHSGGDKYIIQFDFEPLFSRTCNTELSPSNADLEQYKLESPGGKCILGSTPTHYRRKDNTECSIPFNFAYDSITTTPCPCTINDFECTAGYSWDEALKLCVPDSGLRDQPLDCKIGDSYKGLSGYRRIPGDVCQGGESNMDQPIDKKCKAGAAAPPSEPLSHITAFDDHILEMVQVSSSNVSIILNSEGIVFTSNNQGETWSKFETPNNELIVRIIPHETINSRVFLLTADTIYAAEDALLSGKAGLVKLNTPEPFNVMGIPIMDFHPTQADWYTFISGGRDCATNAKCSSRAYVTKDGGKTFNPIDWWVGKCIWARAVDFEIASLQEDAVFCSSYKFKDARYGGQNLPQLPSKNPLQLVLLSSSGAASTVLINENILEFYVIESIMLVALGDSLDPQIMASTDGQKFSLAVFPPSDSLYKFGFTLLESHSDGVFLDILQNPQSDLEYGILFKSNQNGQSFSKSLLNTNRASNGRVDFTKLPGLSGIAIANVVTNPSAIGVGSTKIIQSRISFNDGSTWSPITPPALDSRDIPLCSASSGTCKLHLHSQTSYRGMVTPLGSKNSAGLVIAVGNVGESLQSYESGDVFLSRDGGVNWQEVRKEAHIWAIADNGGLLVLVNDEVAVKTVSYSWDYGQSWADYTFTDQEIRVESMISHEGSNKILLSGHTLSTAVFARTQTVSVQLDFSSLFNRSCDSSKYSGAPNDDFEVWHPTLSNAGEASCFLGQKGAFLRRKKDSICVIGQNFNASLPSPETCPCNEEDFECEVNYFRNEVGKCVLMSSMDPEQPASCILGSKYQGSSGYRKISLSKCSGGVDLTLKVEKDCNTEVSSPTNVKTSIFNFESLIDDYFYFKNSGNILLKDVERSAYISRDEGTTWTRLELGEKAVVAIIEDPNFSTRAFVVTEDSLWITNDNGSTFVSRNLPTPPNIHLTPLFVVPHPLNQNWLLWIGAADCSGDHSSCHSEVSVSWNAGESWKSIGKYVRDCKWGWSEFFKTTNEKTVFCSTFIEKTGDQRLALKMTLARSDNADDRWTPLMATNGFAIEGDYLVVAVPNEVSKAVEIHVSMNGLDFNAASFPTSFKVHDGYTVLPSYTGSLFLHVIQSNILGSEYGTLVKSGWNGLDFHKSIDAVNQNVKGYVDFEKIEGLNGTMIVNHISNPETLSQGGNSKRLVTKMSFDDGETWALLTPPKLDSAKIPYSCGSSCNLHLHAFTERHDKRDSYSSPGAIGLMIGVGNVGDRLGEFNNGDMFLSRDAGKSWTEIVKEAHMVEIGDHGGIILLVNDEGPVSSVKYSLNDGQDFFELGLENLLKGDKIRMQHIITEPSGTTGQFVILGKLTSADKTVAIHLDFSNVWGRMCADDPLDASKSDFELWSPADSNDQQQACVFGSKISYSRRKSMHECYLGDSYLSLPHNQTFCECTLADYECDAFSVMKDNQCILNTQLASSVSSQCFNGHSYPYTGYVKRKISQCSGGLSLAPVASPCGYSSGLSWPLVVFLLIPITLLALFVLAVYLRGWVGGGRGTGRIYLPVDTSSRTGFQRFISSISDTLEDAGDFLVSLQNWISTRLSSLINSRQGYDSVPNFGDHFDPDLPLDSSASAAIDLAWEEEE